MRKRRRIHQRGFTVIDLAISIATLAVVAIGVVVGVDPLEGMAEARDLQRRADAERIVIGVRQYRGERDGVLPKSIANLDLGTVSMIGSQVSGCAAYNNACAVPVTDDTCVDVRELVDGVYLSGIPVAPAATGAWTAGHTGYTIERMADNTVTVRSCEVERKKFVEVSE